MKRFEAMTETMINIWLRGNDRDEDETFLETSQVVEVQQESVRN